METEKAQVIVDGLQEQAAEAATTLNNLVRGRESLNEQIKRQEEYVAALNLVLDNLRSKPGVKPGTTFVLTVGTSHVDRGQFELPRAFTQYLAEDGSVLLDLGGRFIEGTIQRYASRGNSVRIAVGNALKEYFRPFSGTQLEGQILNRRTIKFRPKPPNKGNKRLTPHLTAKPREVLARLSAPKN